MDHLDPAKTYITDIMLYNVIHNLFNFAARYEIARMQLHYTMYSNALKYPATFAGMIL